METGGWPHVPAQYSILEPLTNLETPELMGVTLSAAWRNGVQSQKWIPLTKNDFWVCAPRFIPLTTRGLDQLHCFLSSGGTFTPAVPSALKALLSYSLFGESCWSFKTRLRWFPLSGKPPYRGIIIQTLLPSLCVSYLYTVTYLSLFLFIGM